MYEEDDGWETIQEAQNAVATYVLYTVSSRPNNSCLGPSCGTTAYSCLEIF